MSTAPNSRPGRYGELDAYQLADVVEHTYERDELPDWELVFELTRRTMAAAAAPGAEQEALDASRPA